MSSAPTAVDANKLSVWNVFWLLHVAVEVPVAVLAYVRPDAFQLAGLTPATMLVMKLLATLLITSSIAALLCFSLPDYLPGKRALAIQIFLFHGLITLVFLYTEPGVVLYEPPRFLLEFLPFLQHVRNTTIIAGVHGVVALAGMAWWQATIPLVQAIARRAKTE